MSFVAIAVKNARDLRVEVGIGDDRRDGAVERELKDHAPGGRHGVTEGLHEARGSPVQRKSKREEEEVEPVEGNGARDALRAHHREEEIGSRQEHHDRIHPPLMFQPFARAARRGVLTARCRPLSQLDAEIRRRPDAGSRRHDEPDQGRHHHDLDEDSEKGLPEEDRVREWNDAAAHRSPRRPRHWPRHRGCHRAACRASPSGVRRTRSVPGPRRCRGRGVSRRQGCDSRPRGAGAQRHAPAPRRRRG